MIGFARTACVAAFLGFTSLTSPNIARAQETGPGCPQSLDRGIPAPPPDAPTGSAFARKVEGLSGVQRDAVTEPLLLAGDFPEFLRHLRPVILKGIKAGKALAVIVCVTPDYLAVGSDTDFVRVPMGLRAAMAVASHFGFMLPTTKMVDAIYAQANVRLPPEPLPAGPEMRSTGYFVFHDRLVRQESVMEGAMLGMLVAGQKKDLVLTNRLRANPGRVAIYGWHREDGRPIQSLSTVHGENYADYSHGIRLVSAVAYVDEKQQPLADILQDPQLASIVNSEGPIPNLGALVSSLEMQAVEGSPQPSPANVGRAQSVRSAPAR